MNDTDERFVQIETNARGVAGLTNHGRIFSAVFLKKNQTQWALLPLPDFANWPNQRPVAP